LIRGDGSAGQRGCQKREQHIMLSEEALEEGVHLQTCQEPRPAKVRQRKQRRHLHQQEGEVKPAQKVAAPAPSGQKHLELKDGENHVLWPTGRNQRILIIAQARADFHGKSRRRTRKWGSLTLALRLAAG